MAPSRAPGPGKLTTDRDLSRSPPTAKLLSIDWSSIELATDADALALWQKILPTGEDWEAKLEEVPDDGPIASRLALALLRGGNFTCVPPVAATDCAKQPIDVEPPAAAATLSDPCLRRMLALWAIEALDEADLNAAQDALRAIAAIPPPESQLVVAALDAYPETEQAARLELHAIAFRAGHRELVNGHLGSFDIPHLVEAVQKHHIDGPLEALSAEAHRAVFLAAIADDALHPKARAQAMLELALVGDALPKDVRTAIVAATRAKDCGVAGTAARILVQRGEKKFAPSRPRTKSTVSMMRAMCVLASYEDATRADEASYLLGYVPQRGLDVVKGTYDPYNDVDTDGDGDPHTERTTTLVPRNEVVLPELEDMISAFASCTGPKPGTVCRSHEREFKFGFKPGPGGELLLARLEVADRPPCPSK